jgi:hypothetical protein
MKQDCPNGHEYTELNSYIDKSGYRHCRTCRRERMKIRRPKTVGQGGHNKAKTHCPAGHAYTDKNTLKCKNRRSCRECAKANSLRQNVKRYGITVEQFLEMFAKQGGKCLICTQSFEKLRSPHIDHNHNCCSKQLRSCGKCVRGLLCRQCNILLGVAKENPEILAAAATYLNNNQSN